ncbi:raftlin isoform X2 [Esox lucius]|uniref:Raftlin, lipid raft linker 1a n=2 Tax=Esox lucius TaxID=8010 RepID=A0A3P8XN11_ESOLU|nr:raftlin isoform X2 [Esox lucius]
MGCRLPKPRRAGEERSPGKIYSTLRRPQVETKVGVAYTYHFLDFLLGKEEVSVSSVLCLSSVRELPVQVRELYGQGFVLVAVHPFVHPCGPRPARIQRQLHRAVLIKETQSSEKSQLKWVGRLETDVCVAGHQAPDPEIIQNYVKKIQDMAEQGVLFVGFVQQPGGGPCFLGHWEPEDLSSLHSSPSPTHRPPCSTTISSLEPTVLDLSPTDTKPSQNPFESENDHNTVLKAQEHSSIELRRVGQNATDHHQVKLDFSSIEPIEKKQQFIPIEAADRSSNGTPSVTVRLPLTVHQPNLSPNDSPEKQADSPKDLASDQPNRAQALGPSEHLGDQEQQQCSSPVETICMDRQQNENPEDFIRTLLPNYSPPELTHGQGGPDIDEQSQADRQSLGLDYSSDDLLWSPEHRSKSVSERRCSCGNRGTGSDPDDHQRKSSLLTHNNNHIQVKSSDRDKRTPGSLPVPSRMQLFALYNQTGELSNSMRFYSLRVPLQLQREAGLVTEVDAHWLDHMTQHFTSGARLIDGFFHLGDDNDSVVSSVDSVFIFQNSPEENTPVSYDAIVVEQWTIVDVCVTFCLSLLVSVSVGYFRFFWGVVVRTDYIPLLQSLAPFGWRLMCVLPTPIVRTNSDGSLSTKQILFLQRPALQRKRKDFKKLNLRGRNKAKKNSAEETLDKKEERENVFPLTERGMDGQKRNTEERRDWETRNENESIIERKGETTSQEDFPLGTKGRAEDLNQEVSQENGDVPLGVQEMPVSDANVSLQSDEVKLEVKILPQLSERALFSGVC